MTETEAALYLQNLHAFPLESQTLVNRERVKTLNITRYKTDEGVKIVSVSFLNDEIVIQEE